MRYHTQTLDKNGNKAKHGRGWLYIKNFVLQSEWKLFPKDISFRVGLGHYECAIGISIHLFLFSIYFDLEYNPLMAWIRDKTKRPEDKYGNGRTIGINFHGGSIWIDLWNDPMSTTSKDPWWWHIVISPLDILLGKEKFNKILIEKGLDVIEMPEKEYPVQYSKTWFCYKRPLWFNKKVKRLSVEIPNGIPIPGKGTTSYNCGDDAINGFSRVMLLDDTVGSLCRKQALSILKTRQRYGSLRNEKYQQAHR